MNERIQTITNLEQFIRKENSQGFPENLIVEIKKIQKLYITLDNMKTWLNVYDKNNNK